MDLYKQQIELEKQSLALGQERYAEAVADAKRGQTEADMGPTRGLINRSLMLVTNAIELKRQPKQGPGRGLAAIPLIAGLGSPELAFHVLRACMNGISSSIKLGAVAVGCGNAVFEEIRFRALAEADSKLYRMTQEHIKTATTASRKRKVMNHMAHANVAVCWGDREKLLVGMFLLDALLESTTLFDVTMETHGVETHRVLRARPEVLQWIQDGHERTSMFLPMRQPMVVPPRDWVAPQDGGYLTDIGGRLDMIKTRNKAYLESLGDVDMPIVYRALNAVQSVAWQVNMEVLRVALQCWEQNIAVGKSMPNTTLIPMPAAPCDPSELPQLRMNDPEAYKAWAARASDVYAENAHNAARRVQTGDRLNLATKFSQYPAIYFPHQLDFRGRIYPVPGHLNPQADDFGKGLLRFAHGKVPGERGLYWLAIHIANCFGVDKVPHADRVAWVKARMGMWQLIAHSPLEQDFWMTADDPWQALAAILEYARCSNDSEAVSYLSIPMDGSCNGLQNFSAMLGDETGGSATNLLPSDKPSDVYGQVAAIVTKIVDQDAANGDLYAIGWQGKINRKLVKQPVMTLPYGATMSGMRGQIEQAAKRMYPGLWPKKESWAACGYLAKVTYEAIGQVVVAARAAMEWLQTVARLVSSAEYPIRWTAPNGLPVLQDYRQTDTDRIKIHINGVRTELSLTKDSDKLDRRRQSLAISPNFVHSLDAAHLMRTVCLCLDKGITSFAFIHDSYGTLAADVDTLHWCLREAFIQQYSGNLLAEFADEVASQVVLDEPMPPMPARGNLDLQLVHKSLYFFS